MRRYISSCFPRPSKRCYTQCRAPQTRITSDRWDGVFRTGRWPIYDHLHAKSCSGKGDYRRGRRGTGYGCATQLAAGIRVGRRRESLFRGFGQSQGSGDREGRHHPDGGRYRRGRNDPVAVVATVQGEIYIAEFGGNRVRKVLAGGTIQTVVGNGKGGFGGDAGSATLARINPGGIALDGHSELQIGRAHV